MDMNIDMDCDLDMAFDFTYNLQSKAMTKISLLYY